MDAQTLSAGTLSGPYDLVLEEGLGVALAEATLDPNPSYLDGTMLPPTAVATEIYRTQFDAMAAHVPSEISARAYSGVHGQHELVVHRPISPGEHLHTLVETHSARPSRDNLRITLLHRTYDIEDHLVAEQWWTTVLLGTSAEATGPDLADHGVAELDRSHPTAVETVRIDLAMAERYAEVSGDYSEHHFSVEGARRSGQEQPFLHGLCTMALCARAVVRTVGDGDPSRLERLAVRFAVPAFLDRDLAVQIYELGDDRFALEATCGDDTVIRNGLAVLR